MSEGRFTIASRIYLKPEQRAKLLYMLEGAERELDDWLTELVAAQLETLPEPPQEQAAAIGDPGGEELRRRRAELRRLRPRLNDPHNPPPPWLVQMVSDLEAEVKRLEGRGEG
jgi:hypothetical protein